jgi:hypothetical protein
VISFTVIAQQSYSHYSTDSSIQLEIKTKEKLSWYLYSGKVLLIQSADVDLQLNDKKN